MAAIERGAPWAMDEHLEHGIPTGGLVLGDAVKGLGWLVPKSWSVEEAHVRGPEPLSRVTVKGHVFGADESEQTHEITLLMDPDMIRRLVLP